GGALDLTRELPAQWRPSLKRPFAPSAQASSSNGEFYHPVYPFLFPFRKTTLWLRFNQIENFKNDGRLERGMDRRSRLYRDRHESLRLPARKHGAITHDGHLRLSCEPRSRISGVIPCHTFPRNTDDPATGVLWNRFLSHLPLYLRLSCSPLARDLRSCRHYG